MRRDGRNECYPAAPAGQDLVEPGRPADGFTPTDRRGARKDWVDERNEMIQSVGAHRAQQAATSGTIAGKAK